MNPRTLCLLLLPIAAPLSAEEALDPLAPLTTAEFAVAVDALAKTGKIGKDALFPYIVLQEPTKAELAAGKTPRRAWVNVFDQKARLSEWVVDLAMRAVVSSTGVSLGQAPILPNEYVSVPELVRKDARWQKAMAERGLKPEDIMMDVWAVGPFLDREQNAHRMVKTVSFLKTGYTNPYAHPIEVVALVDLSRGEVLEVRDAGVRDVSRHADDFDADAAKGKPAVLAPPAAPADARAFRLQDNRLTWSGWDFRFALHPREGLVLYTVSHRGRSILHRAALAEMVVPYGDPDKNWMWRNAFDVGEYGLGRMSSPQEPGLDAPPQATLLDATLADEFGKPLVVSRAISVYERDGGIAWRHQDALVGRTDSRRASELVIQTVATLSNYDYALAWVFRQDGSISFEATLTGIMLAKQTAKGASHAGHVGHEVAPGVVAVHHQHFFNFRLDFDVDGERNSVVEVETRPAPPGPANPFGNKVDVVETTLASEKKAARDLSLATHRRWKVVSADKQNELGQPTGYALIPGENSVPFLSKDSPVRRKASFIDHHIWVTRLDPAERHSAGPYPNQGPAGVGLSSFIADDQPIVGQDIVLWYTFGVTHIPRPEEWPVMPAHRTGFTLVPVGFHASNPILGPQTAR
ncbi:MAG: primary-amine oxidase [Elusimicrobia bacterium]|nr:primary-amine oxidase [Elusimicrobiota bacterium]